ncbi:MAG: hypothetical protein ACYTAS_16700 [Planctomycetota bacterium]|jgi:hypothetical protein
MLSFMREQGGENLPGGRAAGTDKRDGASPDQGVPQEFLTTAANSKSLRKSTIVVAVLVAIGLAGLGYMIHQSQPQAALAQTSTEEENKIETAISRLTGVSSEMVSRMDEIVDKFYEFSDVFQVGVGELAKNPFEAEVVAGTMDEEVITEQDDSVRAALLRQARLKQQASTLKLLSVMRSEDGDACMINDRILHQGDTIEGFTITQIGGDSVVLTWQSDGTAQSAEAEDLTITLKLAQ